MECASAERLRPGASPWPAVVLRGGAGRCSALRPLERCDAAGSSTARSDEQCRATGGFRPVRFATDSPLRPQSRGTRGAPRRPRRAPRGRCAATSNAALPSAGMSARDCSHRLPPCGGTRANPGAASAARPRTPLRCAETDFRSAFQADPFRPTLLDRTFKPGVFSSVAGPIPSRSAIAPPARRHQFLDEHNGAPYQKVDTKKCGCGIFPQFELGSCGTRKRRSQPHSPADGDCAGRCLAACGRGLEPAPGKAGWGVTGSPKRTLPATAFKPVSAP
jgi:hypothetical protein